MSDQYSVLREELLPLGSGSYRDLDPATVLGRDTFVPYAAAPPHPVIFANCNGDVKQAAVVQNCNHRIPVIDWRRPYQIGQHSVHGLRVHVVQDGVVHHGIRPRAGYLQGNHASIGLPSQRRWLRKVLTFCSAMSHFQLEVDFINLL